MTQGKSKKRISKICIWAILFAIAFFTVFTVMRYLSDSHGGFAVYSLKDNWDIDFCGKRFAGISRTDKRLYDIRVKRNNIVSMTRKIDVGDDSRRLTLRLYSRMAFVRVSIIDYMGRERIIYYYGYSRNGRKSDFFPGSGYHFIQLPQRSRGKTIKIMEMASCDNAFKGTPDILITETSHAMELFARQRSLGTFITVFMIISGLSVVPLSLFMSAGDRKFFTLTMIGIFSVICGIWCLCLTKTIELFYLDLRLDSLIEYTTLYLMIIPLLFVTRRFLSDAGKAVKAIIDGFVIIDIAFAFIAIILSITWNIRIDTPVLFFHMLLVLESVCISLIVVIRIRKAAIPERIFDTGIITAAIVIIIYILYYNFCNTNDAPSFFELIIAPAVLLFMIITMLAGHIADVFIRKLDEDQKKRLITLAFSDEMTGLSNRAVGEKRLKELDGTGGDYLLVNLDLNYLKRVNDTFGHEAGDRYIKEFSSILQDVFFDADAVCRMGGDEFLVIYSDPLLREDVLRQRLSWMEELEKQRSEGLNGITIDSAYGYAYSNETKGRSSQETFLLSDGRMYQMKRWSKKGRCE